ncbi:hypothetical protein [Photorhabdus luminescens]|nr:hypothetical protein [Photorhabdus luminescens]MCW7764628.1 hypothetical protein [Photorhabdus luminescens subsp. venezuelensis]
MKSILCYLFVAELDNDEYSESDYQHSPEYNNGKGKRGLKKDTLYL